MEERRLVAQAVVPLQQPPQRHRVLGLPRRPALWPYQRLVPHHQPSQVVVVVAVGLAAIRGLACPSQASPTMRMPPYPPWPPLIYYEPHRSWLPL